MAVAGSDMNGHGRVYLYDIDASVATPNSRMDWPKIRQDVRNHGRYTGLNPADVAAGPSTRVLSLRIAPNPVLAGSRIALRPPGGETGYLTIFDPAGRLIARRTFAGEAVLPVRDLIGGGGAAGVYFLRWRPLDGGSSGAARIVVAGQ
jgi:hypothetical protein